MSRQSALVWLMILLGGFASMLWSLRASRPGDARVPAIQAVLYVAEGTPPQPPDPAAATPVLVYLLPPRPEVAGLAAQLDNVNPAGARSFARNHQEMAILLPNFNDVIGADKLASGRMPVAGANEVLAGAAAEHQDQLDLEGRAYQVVGTLGRDDPLPAKAYVLPDHPAHRARLDAADPSVKQGYLLFRVKDGRPGENSQFPKEHFTAVAGSERLDRGTYYAYVAGMVLLVAGGSALLIGGYCQAAKRVTNRWLALPLAELANRKRLLVTLHLAYFGLWAAGTLVIYETPIVQDFLMQAVHKEIETGAGPLRVAGEAYKSGSVARAAGTTLAINFFLGSVLMITLPSLVIPGAGILVALFRALAWGILLAPIGMLMAGAMLPHAWTLLLEGEGYVLATFFAVLVPVYLFRPDPGATIGSRYRRALAVNLKGNLLVLAVLAAAALYEAIEVIWQMTG